MLIKIFLQGELMRDTNAFELVGIKIISRENGSRYAVPVFSRKISDNPAQYTVLIKMPADLPKTDHRGTAMYVKRAIFNEELLREETTLTRTGPHGEIEPIINGSETYFEVQQVNDSLLNTIARPRLNKPFYLPDPQGLNYAYQIERDEQNCRYVIKGLNSDLQERVIYLHDNGIARGYGNKSVAQLSPVEKQLYQNREAIFRYFRVELPAAHHPFTQQMNAALQKHLHPDEIKFYQTLSFEQQYLLFCLATDYSPINPIFNDDPATQGPRNALDWNDPRHQHQNVDGIFALLQSRDYQKKGVETGHLVWLAQQFAGENRALKYAVRSIFDNYSPNMVNTNDLDVQIDAQPRETAGHNHPGFYILGDATQPIGTYELTSWSIFSDAVIQVASQLNNLEFADPNYNNDVLAYSYDRTQGPDAQKTDPALALARLRYWRLATKNVEPENDRPNTQDQHIQTQYDLKRYEIFLRDFRQATIENARQTYTFDDLFNLRNGYMNPKLGMEALALQFVRENKHTLLTNMEDATHAATGVRMIQMLCAALALGRYDGQNFNGSNDDGTKFTRTCDLNTLNHLCYEFLSIQYEMLAKAAILEAIKHPDRRVPLVLTRVGGGVFENPSEMVNLAINVAVTLVQRSGINNIDVVLSGYSAADINEYKGFYPTSDTLSSTAQDQRKPVFTHLRREDFSNGDRWQATSLGDAAEYKNWKAQQQQEAAQQEALRQQQLQQEALRQQQEEAIRQQLAASQPQANTPASLPNPAHDRSSLIVNGADSSQTFTITGLSVKNNYYEVKYTFNTQHRTNVLGTARIYPEANGTFRITTDIGSSNITNSNNPIVHSLATILKHYQIDAALRGELQASEIEIRGRSTGDYRIIIHFVNRDPLTIRATGDFIQTTNQPITPDQITHVIIPFIQSEIRTQDDALKQIAMNVLMGMFHNQSISQDAKTIIGTYLILAAFKHNYHGSNAQMQNAPTLQTVIDHANDVAIARSNPGFFSFGNPRGTESRNTLLRICYGDNHETWPRDTETLTADSLVAAFLNAPPQATAPRQ